jgi:hypothetical protein
VDALEVKPEHTDAVYEDMMKVFLPKGKIELKYLAASYEDARKQAPKARPIPIDALVDYSLLDEIQTPAR